MDGHIALVDYLLDNFKKQIKKLNWLSLDTNQFKIIHSIVNSLKKNETGIRNATNKCKGASKSIDFFVQHINDYAILSYENEKFQKISNVFCL